MNKTYFLDILRMLKKNLGRFTLLTLIVALGVSFYVGIKSTPLIMGYSIDKYNDEYKLMDLTVYSAYGFNDDDIDAIKNIDGVSNAYGNNFLDVLTVRDGTKVVARIHSLSSDVNLIKLIEGRMPINSNECVVEEKQLLTSGFKIGDIIEVESDNLSDFLEIDKFKVVGIINTPYYLNEDKGYSNLNNRILSTYFYVKDDAFINDFYSEVAVTFDNNLISFSSKYENISKYLKEEIEKLGVTQVSGRRDIVLNEAYASYNDGKKDYEDGKKEFDEEIAKANEEIEQARIDIINGEKEIKTGYKELAENKIDVERKLREAEQLINDQRNDLGVKEASLMSSKAEWENKKIELAANLSQIENGLLQVEVFLNQAIQNSSLIESNISALNVSLENINLALQSDPSNAGLIAQKQVIENNLNDLNVQHSALNSTIANLNDKKAELLSQKSMINAGIAEAEGKIGEAYSQIQYGYQALTNAAVELEENKKKSELEFSNAEKDLLQAQKDIEKAQLDLNDACVDFEKEKADGLLELEKAKADLDKALQDIEDLEDGEWIVLDRSMHYASRTFKDTIRQMDAIANVFPVFFFIVAALVCLTTMSRMVDEERGQIGIYRALGYSNWKVNFKYIFYAFIATIAGCIIGNVAGILIFPPVIYEAWGMMYVMPEYHSFLPFKQMFISNLAFIAVILATTWYSCSSDNKEVPASLLRAKAQKNGKKVFLERIDFIWKNLGFTSKVTARNIFRYKNRFFMTILGIGGCTALLLIGLGIRDSISSIIPNQYDVIYKHNVQVLLNDDLSANEINSIFDELKEKSNSVVLSSSYSSKVIFSGKEEVATVNVFNTGDIDKVIRLKTRNVDNNIILDDEGVIISEKLSKLLDIKINDKIRIENFNGVIKEVRVSNITEMYVNHFVFMSNNLYLKTFGVNSIKNDIFMNTSEDFALLQDELLKNEKIESIISYHSILDNFNSMISGLNMVVYVILAASASLVVLVLSNLTSINIAERLREIATLKVLGFSNKEVNNYIYKENLFLTVIGSMCGIPMGMALHIYIITLVEMDEVMFGRNISLTSLAVAVLFTLAFSFIVNILMNRKLKKINMIESLKSVE